MTSKFSIDNRELLQRISSGEAVVGIDFGNLIVRELAAFRLAAMDSEPVPVVIDDVSIFEAAIEKCKTCDSIDEHAWNHGVLAVMAEYESCRAAMLQSDNSPVITDDGNAKFGNFQHYWHSKGYVLVPNEPTEAMCDISHIGVDVYCGITDDNEYYSIGGAEAAKVWKAMLAAAMQEVRKSNVVDTYQGADGKEHEIIYLSSSQKEVK